MKDYIAQQRRLQEQINNCMQRNRELQREVEEKEAKERQEREAKLKETETSPEIEGKSETKAEKQTLTLDIKKQQPQRAQTLESPAFIPESELVFVPPPPTVTEVPEEEGTEENKESDKPVHLPLDLPLGHAVDSLKSPPIENIPSPLTDLSPTSRFIISKVVNAQTQAQEAGLPGPNNLQPLQNNEPSIQTDKNITADTDQSLLSVDTGDGKCVQSDSVKENACDPACQSKPPLDMSCDQIGQSENKTVSGSKTDQSDKISSSVSHSESESNSCSSGNAENNVTELKSVHHDSAQNEAKPEIKETVKTVQNTVIGDKSTENEQQNASIANLDSLNVENNDTNRSEKQAQNRNSSQIGDVDLDLIIKDITVDPLNGDDEAIAEEELKDLDNLGNMSDFVFRYYTLYLLSEL